MKSDSPLFDRIRVKPDKDRRPRAQCPACEWPNCEAPATHRAPKGRLREREYWRFCLEQFRGKKQAYNFFSGLNTQDNFPYLEGDGGCPLSPMNVCVDRGGSLVSFTCFPLVP